MGSTRPTIYDVAREAAVSKSLVSLVLNQSPKVSAASRESVERAIHKLGYRPNRAASHLAAGRTRVIGVLIDDYANPWFVELLRGLDHSLAPHGYRLSVQDSATASRGEDHVLDLLSMGTDGLVIARDVPDTLIAGDVPPLVVAGTRENVPVDRDVVANDDDLGARLATEHLITAGHQVIAHLSAAGGAARARRASFLATAAAAGVHAIATDFSGPATEHAGYDSALRILREHDDVTAIFAANDVMAVGALGAARHRGIDVPGRLSILGYDNTALAQTRLIDLSSVDDNGFGVGREAGRLLWRRMTGDNPPPTRRLLEPALIVRGTTGRAP